MKLMSASDSKRILDEGGAEKLRDAGTLLFWEGGDLVRGIQPYISFAALRELISFIGNQKGYPSKYLLPNPNAVFDFDPDDRDPLFEDAARLIVMHQQGSTSLIQRKLKLGYNRCGRIIDQLEAAGIVGPFYGSKAREVFIPDEYALEQFLSNLDTGVASTRPYETEKKLALIKEEVAPPIEPLQPKEQEKPSTLKTKPVQLQKTNVFAQPKAKEKTTGFWKKLIGKFK
jgi:Ftsk gamma domain